MEVKSLAFSSSSIKLPASQDVSKVMNSKTPDCYSTRPFYTQRVRPSEAEVGDFEEEINCRGTLNTRFEESWYGLKVRNPEPIQIESLLRGPSSLQMVRTTDFKHLDWFKSICQIIESVRAFGLLDWSGPVVP